MRPEVAICPTCEFPHRNSPPTAGTVAWSDDCPCSDFGTCLYHSTRWDERPKRPAQDVLAARRAKVEERQNAEFEKKKQRFARAEALEKELAEARAEAARLRETVDKLMNRTWAQIPRLPVDHEADQRWAEEKGRENK